MKRILLLVSVLALVATACGGSADADDGVASIDETQNLETVDATIGPELSEEEALLAFSQCLRDNGLDIDDPTVDADGNLRLSRPNTADGQGQGNREEFQSAREACSDLLEGVTLGFQGIDQTELEDDLLQFAMCMRENGYEEMPDPDLSATGTPGQAGGGPFGELDRGDPDYQAAAEQCQDVLAGFGRGFGGGGRGAGNG
ncbi:MAG: hypothetical protein HKN91_01880 [Acidimicrobiia bacterium]|nr:hypothetical protein [Acidimicrobiia bacterium]